MEKDDRLVVHCTTCGKKYHVAKASSGKRLRCKKCEGWISIPFQDVEIVSNADPIPPPLPPQLDLIPEIDTHAQWTPPTPPAPTEPTSLVPLTLSPTQASTLAIVLGLIAMSISTSADEGGPVATLNYLGCVSVAYGSIRKVAAHLNWKSWWLPFAAVSITWMSGIAATDTYTEAWKSEEGFYFTDTYRRFWNHGLFHRKLFRLGSDIGGYYHGEGRLTIGSMKKHGEWVATLGPFSDTITLHQYYWYGEEVSEGRWHILNGD